MKKDQVHSVRIIALWAVYQSMLVGASYRIFCVACSIGPDVKYGMDS